MYAIIEIGGGQFKVSEKDRVLVNRLAVSSKDIRIKSVLFGKDKSTCYIGEPYVKDAFVECEVLGDRLGEKKIAFKYRDRKSSQSKKGHRQRLTELLVKKIHLT